MLNFIKCRGVWLGLCAFYSYHQILNYVHNADVSGIRNLKQCISIQLLFIYKYAVSISSSRKSDWMGVEKKIWKSFFKQWLLTTSCNFKIGRMWAFMERTLVHWQSAGSGHLLSGIPMVGLSKSFRVQDSLVIGEMSKHKFYFAKKKPKPKFPCRLKYQWKK